MILLNVTTLDVRLETSDVFEMSTNIIDLVNNKGLYVKYNI